LVAGSNTWSNYRHQADVFHAYQELVRCNFPKNKIIVLAYDDIADDPINPFPGKVFNKPSPTSAGWDVYKGIRIDYRGTDVTPANFLAVLTGNAAAVAGRGTARVLHTAQNDSILIYYSGQGAPGLITFPTGGYLYKSDLQTAFPSMIYKSILFYLDSCESASMFTGLSPNLNVYAMTGTSLNEDSWATYCPGSSTVNSVTIPACLGG
jgi:legumain